jgi:hypothetical protein
MKTTAIKCLLLLLLAFFSERCAVEKSSGDIAGVWYTYSNNTYLEIIIWPGQIHSKTGKSGNNLWISNWLFYYSPDDLLESSLWDCQSKNDSLLFFDSGVRINGHSATSHDDQIHLTIDTIKLQLSRVSEYDAMSQILKIDTLSWDNMHFRNYLEGYYHRRDSYKHNDASR